MENLKILWNDVIQEFCNLLHMNLQVASLLILNQFIHQSVNISHEGISFFRETIPIRLPDQSLRKFKIFASSYSNKYVICLKKFNSFERHKLSQLIMNWTKSRSGFTYTEENWRMETAKQKASWSFFKDLQADE